MDKGEKSDGWNLDPFEAIYVLLIITLLLGTVVPAMLSYFTSNELSFFGIPLSGIGSFFIKYSWLFKFIGFSVAGVGAVATMVWNKMADSIERNVLSNLYPSSQILSQSASGLVDGVTANGAALGPLGPSGKPILIGNGNGKSVKSKWEKIINLTESSEESNWRLAIIEADIILDSLLEILKLPGQTIGDKLKAVEPTDFLTLDYAWEAHKARNAIAHEGSDYLLNQREARRIISLYGLVFKEFYLI